MLSMKFKGLKKMAAFSAIAAACGFAKADTNKGFEDIQALPNGQVLVHNTDTNGVANIQGIKTPFMFTDADLNRGFAPAGLENATSVASDGTNCYANVDGKVVSFKLSKDGIPSVTDKNEYNMIVRDGTNPQKTVNGRIIRADEDGFVATHNDNISKFTKMGDEYVATYQAYIKGMRSTYVDGKDVYALTDSRIFSVDLENKGKTSIATGFSGVSSFAVVKNNDGDKVTFLGRANGKVNNRSISSVPVTAISISKDRQRVYATTGANNEYAVFDAQTGDFISTKTVPGVENVKKVIDNPKDSAKILYITQQKMGAYTK